MYYKKGRKRSLLLAACMMGSVVLAGCGSNAAGRTQASNDAAVQTAAETEETSTDAAQTATQTEYVEQDPATGIAIQEWTGTYARLYQELMDYVERCEAAGVEPEYPTEQVGAVVSISDVIDDSLLVTSVIGQYFDYENLPEERKASEPEMTEFFSRWCSPDVVIPVDASMSQEEIEKDLRKGGWLTEGQTVTPFTTKSGKTMYQIPCEDGSNTSSLDCADYISEGTRTIFSKLDEEWEIQRQEIDYCAVEKASGIEFTAMDYDGNTVDESIFRNAKLTMVNIWGTTCAPCIEEMPELQRINDEIEDVQVITIIDDMEDLEDEDLNEEAHEITAARGMTLPVLLNSKELKTIFPHSGTPTSYLVNADGDIVSYQMVGYVGYDGYVAWIQEAME